MLKLLKIKSHILLALIVILCASCTGIIYDTKPDVVRLQDSNAKLGAIVFRPMFFDSEESAQLFALTGSSNTLTTLNESGAIQASQISQHLTFEIGKDPRDSIYNNSNMAHFIIKPHQRTGFASWTLATLRPGYFYSVRMLPEGNYFISHLSVKLLEKQFTEKDKKYYFQVKAGYINYLGDVYWMSPVITESNLFTPDKYRMKVLTHDRYEDAKDFMKKHFPEIALPMRKSLFQKH